MLAFPSGSSLSAVILALVSSLFSTSLTAHAVGYGDRSELESFVGLPAGKSIVNAQLIENLGLMRASLRIKPWSDTFWPDLQGSIAWDYANGQRGIYGLFGWRHTRAALMGRVEARRDIRSLTPGQIDAMSPAEKYDLLLGDDEWTLSRSVVASVDKLHQEDMLALWSGVCHGWSPASLSMPRPVHSFTVNTPSGHPVTFYPADVRALESYLWANSRAQGDVKVKGEQCYSGARENRNGRLLDPACFDVNPAFFHLLMVNQLGLKQKGFVMDRSYRGEVQNQPVFAYALSYYDANDREAKPGATLREAKRAFSRWDPYKEFRSPEAVALVGVDAVVAYRKEIQPKQRASASSRDDESGTMRIRYDLELDADDNIVGGEWRDLIVLGAPAWHKQVEYVHPDIVWLVPDDVAPWTYADADIQAVHWDGRNGVAPSEWRQAARKAALNLNQETFKGRRLTIPRPQLIRKAVDLLVELSRS